jgi:hypothetical protein
MASIAANLRSVCASERGPPEWRIQESPAAAPHVGQETEDTCSGVRSRFFTMTECDYTASRIYAKLHTAWHWTHKPQYPTCTVTRLTRHNSPPGQPGLHVLTTRKRRSRPRNRTTWQDANGGGTDWGVSRNVLATAESTRILDQTFQVSPAPSFPELNAPTICWESRQSENPCTPLPHPALKCGCCA